MFFEEGEPLLDGEPGDLKFVLRTRPHARFRRAGNDLQHNLTISLVDALVGFSTEARLPPAHIACCVSSHGRDGRKHGPLPHALVIC